jgi:hypothetical protein
MKLKYYQYYDLRSEDIMKLKELGHTVEIFTEDGCQHIYTVGIKPSPPRHKYKFLGKSKKRAVFLLPSGLNVVKIPLDESGVADNCLEDFRYRKCRDKWYPLAKCRLVNYTNYYLIMEYVKPIDNPYAKDMGIPDWVTQVDCGQVGFNLAGRLVAYDYGG